MVCGPPVLMLFQDIKTIRQVGWSDYGGVIDIADPKTVSLDPQKEERKDITVAEHSQRVAYLVREAAKNLGYKDRDHKDQLDILELAALYHDVGKIFVMDVLNAARGQKLTSGQQELVVKRWVFLKMFTWQLDITIEWLMKYLIGMTRVLKHKQKILLPLSQ